MEVVNLILTTSISIMKLLLIFSVLILAVSCSDDCVTCTNSSIPENIPQTFCDDGETNFTDENGNVITFDELIESLEKVGQICE